MICLQPKGSTKKNCHLQDEYLRDASPFKQLVRTGVQVAVPANGRKKFLSYFLCYLPGPMKKETSDMRTPSSVPPLCNRMKRMTIRPSIPNTASGESVLGRRRVTNGWDSLRVHLRGCECVLGRV